MDGWMGGRKEWESILKEDRVRASSLVFISVSKYGGICYCMRPVLKTRHRPGRKLEGRKERGGRKKKKKREQWEKV